MLTIVNRDQVIKNVKKIWADKVCLAIEKDVYGSGCERLWAWIELMDSFLQGIECCLFPVGMDGCVGEEEEAFINKILKVAANCP